METVLTVKDLSVTYVNKSRRVMAVRRASFSIDKGDSLGIVGESGSGKSTLAMALLRLHPKSTEITGQALFDGKDLLVHLQRGDGRAALDEAGRGLPEGYERPEPRPPHLHTD